MVAIVTDVDVAAFDKVPRMKDDGKLTKDANGKTVYDYLPRNSNDISSEIETAIESKKANYDSQKVKAFVSPHWTLEYCLFKSASLACSFKCALTLAHPQIDPINMEGELAKKLVDKTLDKTAVAHHLARMLEEDLEKKPPEISLDTNDESVKYLFAAIKHACRN